MLPDLFCLFLCFRITFTLFPSYNLAQSVLRKIQDIGLAVSFNSREITKRLVKSLIALAFVPTVDVEMVFTILLGDLEANEQNLGNDYVFLRQLYQYFWNTYVKINAVLPPLTWNQFERVRLELPRSDGSLEGFHHAIQNCFGIHPPLWNFFDSLVGEQHSTEMKWLRHCQGHQIQREQAAIWRRVTFNIRRVVRRYPMVDGYLAYLRTLAYFFTIAKHDRIRVE